VHTDVFKLLEWWRDTIEELPVTLGFDVAALLARRRAQEERLAFLEHELGIVCDPTQVLSRFAPLAAILALDDVRDATAAREVLAWDPDDLWPFPVHGVAT
jgi:hypothetical protein